MPSQASIRNLLGELYNKMDNMHGSAQQLLQCLTENPFKLTAYINMCNIAPDAGQPDSVISPSSIFKEFNLDTTPLERSTEFNLPLMSLSAKSKTTTSTRQPKHTTFTASPPMPATIQQYSTASASASALASAYSSTSGTPAPAPSAAQKKQPRLDYLMPMVRSSYNNVSLDQLRALVDSSIQAHPEMPSWNDEPER